jgi:hypothetical protein
MSAFSDLFIESGFSDPQEFWDYLEEKGSRDPNEDVNWDAELPHDCDDYDPFVDYDCCDDYDEDWY